MIIIHDFRLAILIAQQKKVTHRWPAGVDERGFLRDPKMRPKTHHKIYEKAPHGSHGSRGELPLLEVVVDKIWETWPYEWQDADMTKEGFENVYAYGVWWDAWRKGDKLCKDWIEMQNEPFWICTFQLVGITHYFAARFEEYARRNRIKIPR